MDYDADWDWDDLLTTGAAERVFTNATPQSLGVPEGKTLTEHLRDVVEYMHAVAEPPVVSDEEKRFIQAFWLADFGDTLPQKVFADWLDEHGRPGEARRARLDLPPAYCACRGTGTAGFKKLPCRRCGGTGKVKGATVEGKGGPVRFDDFNFPCPACAGKEFACAGVCPACNGRWFPRGITAAGAGDPVWMWSRWPGGLVRGRPEFQGDPPFGRLSADGRIVHYFKE